MKAHAARRRVALPSFPAGAMSLWPDLSSRVVLPEVMDRPDLDPDEHTQALRSLARINAVSGSARILWPPIAKLARVAARAGIRVLDLATGSGDVPIRLWQRARRRGICLSVAGCDRSPVAVAEAKARAKSAGADVAFFRLDVATDAIPGDFDVITCSLFLHHLSTGDAEVLLQKLAAATRRLVLVNDLSRGRIGYTLAWGGCRLLSRSRVVHTDGPLSVRAAFTPSEALALAENAGLARATAERRWPCRFLLSWARPQLGGQ